MEVSTLVCRELSGIAREIALLNQEVQLLRETLIGLASDRKTEQTESQTRTDEDGCVWEYRNGNWWQLGKTENCSEKPNNCELCANGESDIEACGYCRHGDLYEPKDEPTISKMEQVDKDINVRSKDEPQTETEVIRTIIHKMIDNTDIAEDAYPDLRQRLHDAVDKYEPQTIRCPKCGRSDYIREFGKDFSVTAEKAGFKYKCINCNTYIEPQTERSE